MSLLNFIPKKVLFFLSTLIISSLVYSCGIYKPVDSRKISPNAKERVKKSRSMRKAARKRKGKMGKILRKRKRSLGRGRKMGLYRGR